MHLHMQVPIDCPPAKLWPLLTEPARIKSWLVELVDETPEDPARTSGVGAASTMRLKEGGKVATYRSVVTAWEPERKVAIRLTGGSFAAGMAMDVTYDITPNGTGSLLDYDVVVPLKGAFVLMAPLIWLVSKSNANKSLGRLAEVAHTAT